MTTTYKLSEKELKHVLRIAYFMGCLLHTAEQGRPFELSEGEQKFFDAWHKDNIAPFGPLEFLAHLKEFGLDKI